MIPISIDNQVKLEIVRLLFKQSNKLIFGHTIAAAIVATWFYHIIPVNHWHLAFWLLTISVYSLSRVFAYRFFIRQHSFANVDKWLLFWVVYTGLLAIFYSAGFIYFAPNDSAVYTAVVGLSIISICASSIISCGASVYAMLGFTIPLVLPNIIYFSIYGGSAGVLLGLSLVAFSATTFYFVRNVNSAFKASIRMNFQYKAEIAKRKQVEKELQEISRRDGLTGVFNRRYFNETLDIEIGRAYRNHLPLCLLMFDLDYFKEYNDAYGHVGGDNCLVSVADIISKLTSRKGDFFARYGGEEFAIILPNVDLEGAAAFAHKLQGAVQSKCIPHNSTKLTSLKCVTISLGVTNLLPFTKMSASELIQNADKALYEAKADGRNRVSVNNNNGLNEKL